MMSQMLWPTKADVSGAAMALVRLHRLYSLDYADLLRGHFLHERSYPLTSSELTYLTKAALELGLVCDARELLAALEVISKKVDGLEMKSVAKLRDRVSQLSTSKMADCNKNRSESEVPVCAIDGWNTASDQFSKTSARQAYEEMCRKTIQASFAFGSGRDCYMHATFIPYLRYRSEVVNSDPLILVFHDVIDDAEISEIKDLAFGKLSPSSLALTQVAHEKHLVRVSQNAWLFDSTPTLTRISRRVELVTGLSTRVLSENTHAEPYQVLNYGLGGVYGPHEDSVRLPRRTGNEDVPLLRNSGDRTATWMYYLSDVPLGGATVFPFLQAGIRPQKGTAVLWYNLKRNGEGDMRVVHAGCPVLYGDKWVANKWLREIGNVFKRPCLLDPSL
ncbi:prolyl 4-hydroxylase subunit alpha-2-like isoform X2 [Pomacea canaliculata]|nr:prolyl 4-hydroxylase subunit alpha-2-like isoform X2 [Pomacea canaliculata]